MKPEEIKVGETYNVRVKINTFNLARNAAVVWDCGGHPCYFRLEDFTHITPANGTKNTETAPKYDPCRKFREGDIVTPCQVKGRWHSPAWEGRSGIRCTVTSDEDEDGIIWVKDPDSIEQDCADCVYFQLVTPVEELEPYSVKKYSSFYAVERYNHLADRPATYDIDFHPHAKEACEEADRLNEAYRKEQE